jgi:hypothetical protein
MKKQGNGDDLLKDCKIFHFRWRPVNGDSKSGMDWLSRGGATIVVTPEGVVGVALCSPLDGFNKRRGALIAAGRARGKNPFRRCTIPEDNTAVNNAASALRTLVTQTWGGSLWLRQHAIAFRCGRTRMNLETRCGDGVVPALTIAPTTKTVELPDTPDIKWQAI